MIRSRLYLKIYLTVIGSLALVVLTLSLLAMMGRLDTRGPLEERIDRFATVMLAEHDTPAARQGMLDRLALALDADIAIFDPAGRYVQGAGEKITSPEQDSAGLRPRMRVFNAVLPDGSRLVAFIRKPFAPPRHNLIITLLVVAAVVGVAAYPVVRNLTRRLETVRRSMEIWGNGTLSRARPSCRRGRDHPGCPLFQPGGGQGRSARRIPEGTACQCQPRTALAARKAPHGDRNLRVESE